jgi:hypothetical protein
LSFPVFPYLLLFACSSPSHVLVVCSPSVCVCFLPPKQITQPSPSISHHTPIFTRPRHKPSHRKPWEVPKLPLPFHPLSLNIHAPIWRHGSWTSTGQRARRFRRMGHLRVPVRRLRRRSLGSPQHSPWGPLRARPNFPELAALATGANSATRDVFKRATDCRGEANRLAISDPLTDTLHLTPRGVIVATTVLHGTMADAKVDALRLPLKKKLSAVSDLPAHIVTFRGILAWLATAGQAPLPLDGFRLFIATLTPFPVFQQYTLLFTVANGQLRNIRSRLMPLTSFRNCTTS